MAVTILLFTLIPLFLLKNESGQSLGLAGAFVWPVVCASSFLLTLLFLSAFLLPAGTELDPPEEDDSQSNNASEPWEEGLRLVYRYLRTALVPWGQSDRKEVTGLTVESADVLQRFKAAMIDSHLSLALFKGKRYSRAAGPGYVRLRSGERAVEAIDLRSQRREVSLRAVTKEGIPLDATFSVTFRVRQHEATQQRHDLQRTIFLLTGADSLDPYDQEIYWYDRIAPLAVDILTDAISNYKLDQLFEHSGNERSQLVSICNGLTAVLEERIARVFRRLALGDQSQQGTAASAPDPTSRSPVSIEKIEVESLTLPDYVVEQRIKNWKKQWMAYVQRHKFEGEAEASTHLQRARAQAQIDMLDKITEHMEDLVPPLADEDWNETVLLRMITALESTVIDDDAHPDVLQKALNSIMELTKWLK